MDITELENLRHRLNEAMETGDQKLSPLSFIIKVCISGLKEFPNVNASLDTSGKTLYLKRYYNIGMALDMPGGLIVPVQRAAPSR